MKVYDFDKTIYKDDSTVDFYFFALKKHFSVALLWPSLLWAAFLWCVGFINKTGFKQKFYKFLTKIDDIDLLLEEFWDKHEYKIKDFYKENQSPNDVIISASPEFLLKPIAKRLGIKNLYASRVDKKSGRYTGVNCWGEEKVKRFYQAFGNDAKIEEFYSDSLSDAPLACISESAYIVVGDELISWEEYKPKKGKLDAFFSREFILFLIVGGINTLNGVLFSWFYSLFLNPNVAFVAGYITSLGIAFLLNSFFIFKEKLKFVRFFKFCISYIPNFIIQNVIVILVYNIMEIEKLIAYVLAAIIGIPVTFLAVKLFAFKK